MGTFFFQIFMEYICNIEISVCVFSNLNTNLRQQLFVCEDLYYEFQSIEFSLQISGNVTFVLYCVCSKSVGFQILAN